MNLKQKHANKHLLASAVAALIAAISSTLCCIAPLLYLLFGLSSSWLVSLNQLAYLRVPMLLISLLSFGYGFWLLTFSKKIICTKYFSRKGLARLYSLLFVLTLFFLFYPELLPYFLE